MSVTPQMNLVLPVPSIDPGPEWAQELNEAFETVDDHDHTSGKGKKVPVSGIDVNQDFELNSFRITEANSVKFDNLAAPLSGAINAGSIQEVLGNLYFTNSGGVPVQITAGNAIISNVIIPSSPLMPSGTVLDFAGSAAPVGFLLCDGSAVSRTTYNDLFSALGTIWGVGDGSTTFNLPNFNGRSTIGSGTYVDSVDGSVTRSITQITGAASHILTSAQMPSHTHIQDPHNHNVLGAPQVGQNPGQADEVNSSGSVLGTTSSTVATNQFTGGGLKHNNMQPSVVVLKMIKT